MPRHHGAAPLRLFIAVVLLASAPAPALAASNTILITEVEADPPTLGFDAPWEWFELTNVSAQARTLTNWTIADNQSSDVLPEVTLAPGECVIYADTTHFRTGHPGYGGRVVHFAGIGAGLENAADRVLLSDASGTAVDCVSWGTNTTCFSPALVVSGTNSIVTFQRTASPDTDSASDWISANETPCPGAVGVGVGVPPPGAVPRLALAPNPCAGRATITCANVSAGPLRIAIHDVAGRRVRVLHDDSSGAVRHLAWDGLDEKGRALPAGVYLVSVATPGRLPASGRLLLLP